MDIKWVVFALEAIALLVFGAANILSGRFLGAAIVIGLATLAAACAWALRPTGRALLTTRAGESPHRAGSNPPPRR